MKPLGPIAGHSENLNQNENPTIESVVVGQFTTVGDKRVTRDSIDLDANATQHTHFNLPPWADENAF